MERFKIDTDNIFELSLKINSDGSREIQMSEEEWKAATPEKLAALHGATQETKISNKSYPLLSSTIEEYYAHKKRLRKTYKPDVKTIGKYRRLIEMLGDVEINKVSRDDAKKILDKITALPADSAKFRGMTIDEILEEDYDDTLTVKSINDHLGEYRSFWGFLNSEYNLQNIFNGLVVAETDKERLKTNQLRLNFKKEDLQTIFKGSRFNCQAYSKNYEFWTPIIALHTGARRNEIAQLRAYDIKEENGFWYFDFNEKVKKDDTGKKKLKNVGSIRKTPIHPKLIELGFLDFVKNCKEYRLFPELGDWTDKEGYGRYIGDNFNALLKRLGIDDKKTFHSFRGTFTSALEKAGVSERDRFLLTGREQRAKTTEERNYLEDREIEYLHSQIIKVDFSDALKDVQFLA